MKLAKNTIKWVIECWAQSGLLSSAGMRAADRAARVKGSGK